MLVILSNENMEFLIVGGWLGTVSLKPWFKK